MAKHSRDFESIAHIARNISSPNERAAYLDRVCGADLAFRRRVVSLLANFATSPGALVELPQADVQPTIDMSPIKEEPGSVIGCYKLLQQVGEGGFGVVYMAEQQEPIRRKVALKLIKPGMDTKEVIARFEAERQALALMDHPNIAQALSTPARPNPDDRTL